MSIMFLFLILLILYQRGLAEICANIIVSFDDLQKSLATSKDENSELANENIYQVMSEKFN